MARPLKQLERWGKALALRALARLLPEGVTPPPDWTARPYRVLYLRYDRIGDMILSSGLLRAIATSHPGITLDVLASPANRPVLDGNPYIHECICLDKKNPVSLPGTLRTLRRRRYDVVVDPMIDKASLNATLLMLATGARYRVGVGGRRNAFVYTLPVAAARADAHHIVREAATLTAFGIDPARTDLSPAIFIDDAVRAAAEAVWQSSAGPTGAGQGSAGPNARLLVNVSTHHTSRRWPEDRFIAVVRHASTRPGIGPILLVGLPREQHRIERIAQASGARFVPTPRLTDALALVAAADLVFTPDTSIGHAAAAFDRPAVVMIGPGRSPFEPWGNRGRNLHAETDDFASIPAARVADALDAVLAEWAAGARTGSFR